VIPRARILQDLPVAIPQEFHEENLRRDLKKKKFQRAQSLKSLVVEESVTLIPMTNAGQGMIESVRKEGTDQREKTKDTVEEEKIVMNENQADEIVIGLSKEKTERKREKNKGENYEKEAIRIETRSLEIARETEAIVTKQETEKESENLEWRKESDLNVIELNVFD